MGKFESAPFKVDNRLVDIFVEHFDGNPVHRRENSNEILPKNTVPGLMAVAMAAKAALQISDFKEILCARGFKIKFHSPVFREDTLIVRGVYDDSPHKERPNVIFRVNECDIVNASTQKLLISYEITQLLRKT